ncbi:unnamed protein product [Camellia sinensis]
MDTSNTTNLFHMDIVMNNQENEFPEYDNNTMEMDSSGESVESEDIKDSEDSPDSADSKGSEDNSWDSPNSANDPWFNTRGNACARQATPVTLAAGSSNTEDEIMNEMVQLRDEIATTMWNNHRVHPSYHAKLVICILNLHHRLWLKLCKTYDIYCYIMFVSIICYSRIHGYL